MEILENWDFGFVHQVLSFLRTDNVNESISAGFRSLQPDALDRYIIVQRYAPRFLDAAEILLSGASPSEYIIAYSQTKRSGLENLLSGGITNKD